jgi:hypothetical protein
MEITITLVILCVSGFMSALDRRNWLWYMGIAGFSIFVLTLMGLGDMTIGATSEPNASPMPENTTIQVCDGILRDGQCCEAFVNDKGINCKAMEKT